MTPGGNDADNGDGDTAIGHCGARTFDDCYKIAAFLIPSATVGSGELIFAPFIRTLECIGWNGCLSR